MGHGYQTAVYVNEENQEIIDKVDEVKPDTVPRAHIIFEALELWLEEQEDGHEDAERP